jgi:hypothetical protein
MPRFNSFPGFGGFIQSAPAPRHGRIDAGGPRHEIRRTRLEPAQTYRCRTADPESPIDIQVVDFISDTIFSRVLQAHPAAVRFP